MSLPRRVMIVVLITLSVLSLVRVRGQDPGHSQAAVKAAAMALEALRAGEEPNAAEWIRRWRGSVGQGANYEWSSTSRNFLLEVQRHLDTRNVDLLRELLLVLSTTDAVPLASEAVASLKRLLAHDDWLVRILAFTQLSMRFPGDPETGALLVEHLRRVRRRDPFEWKVVMGRLMGPPSPELRRYVAGCLGPRGSTVDDEVVLDAALVMAYWGETQLSAEERRRLDEIAAGAPGCDVRRMILAYRFASLANLDKVLSQCDDEECLWPDLRDAVVARRAQLGGDRALLSKMCREGVYNGSSRLLALEALGHAWTIESCSQVAYGRREWVDRLFDEAWGLLRWTDLHTEAEVKSVRDLLTAMRKDWLSIERLLKASERHRREEGEWPTATKQLLGILPRGELDPIEQADLCDYLGSPFRVRLDDERFRIEGKGPDGEWGTPDDIGVESER